MCIHIDPLEKLKVYVCTHCSFCLHIDPLEKLKVNVCTHNPLEKVKGFD